METTCRSNLFFFDVETSGSCPIRNGIISMTCVVADSGLNIIETFQRKVRPPDLNEKTWSMEAQAVHGISYNEVLNFMPNEQFCYEFLCFMVKYKRKDNFPLQFICHANDRGMLKLHPYTKKALGGWEIYPWFDYFFMEWAFRKSDAIYSFWKVFNTTNIVSTVKMGRDNKYKKNGLKLWAERLGFKLDHHNDLSDTLCCLEVYKYLTVGFLHEQKNRNGSLL